MSGISASEVVELRVHGVSGTPPEELLDCPLVEQLAGDAKAGFYRPRLYEEEHDPRRLDGKPAEAGPRLEGYAWGGLTSGAPTRALWLLLLPFTLTNVAPRMRPGGQHASLRWLWYASRLLALSMTMLIVTSLSGVGVDLIAWQCRAGTRGDCSHASPGWIMQPLLGMSQEHRMAVGVLLPLLAIVVLWQLSGRTINSYEGVPIASPEKLATCPGADDVEPALDSRWMWSNEYMVRRLRHAHLQVAFATTLWILTSPFTSPWIALRVVLALVGAYVLVVLWLPSYVGRERSQPLFVMSWVVWGVLGACGVIIAVALVGFQPLGVHPPDKGLPGYAVFSEAIFLAQLVLLLVFVVIICGMARAWSRQREPDAPQSLGDRSAILLAALAVFLGAVFSSGSYVYATGWLTTGSLRPGFEQLSNAADAFHVPDTILDALRAYTTGAAALAVMVALGVVGYAGARIARMMGWRQWPRGDYTTWLELTYPGRYPVPQDLAPSEREENQQRAQSIARTFWIGHQVDRMHRLVAAIVGIGLVITTLFTGLLFWNSLVDDPAASNCLIRWHDYLGAQYAQAHVGEKNLVRRCGSDSGFVHSLYEGFPSARSLQGTGAYLVVATLILLVGLGAAAFRSSNKRKSIGILWDLASFWPRAAHPFAAPCYAERAVPDLVTRLHWYAGDRDTCIVLAAHSQGTVISAATLLQLKAVDDAEAADQVAPVLPKIGFLSFGCVLRRLYARYFPAYFSTAQLDRLRDVLTLGTGSARWRNLWRYSDYLGGQVTAGPPPLNPPANAIEVMSADPIWARAGGATIWPKANQHSYYWADPVFAPNVAELAAMLLPARGETHA